ncbi:hypothetical protein ACFXDO_18855 [Streptomyces nigra]|uniref:hypothetical protein n=1 Tax=Streptomyces nigra TaxID=1827580 RepID=UPI00367B4DEF
MSRHAPTPPQLTVQESSLLIEWDIDRFFPESEEPDRIILIFSAGDSTVERFLDSSERSVELSAELLRPLAGMILTITIGFQWGQDPPLMTAGAIYLPKVDEGGTALGGTPARCSRRRAQAEKSQGRQLRTVIRPTRMGQKLLRQGARAIR